MANQHVLVIPYPVQGHVVPLMELAQSMAKHGFRITFVNAEFSHHLMVKALEGKSKLDDRIHLVSVPDGLESKEALNAPGKLSEVVFKIMPGKIEELIRNINTSEDGKITCVIADQSLGWAQEVAKKMEIKCAAFLPAAAATLVLGFSIPKLIDDGVINSDGTPIMNQTIQFEPTMPIMSTSDFVWTRAGNLTMQKIIFKVMVQNNKSVKSADWLICNSTYDLEPGAFTLAPEIVPVGPLLARNRKGESAGHFWPDDLTWLEWLDQQPPCSVIYIAFGSITVVNRAQFQELASGLELTNRPFLWVVRPDNTGNENEAYPEGFLGRVASRGKIVDWAPQQKVLSHPSVACFLSHCGWNSTIESVSNGVPMICWPSFADQFINQSYICDIWKVGVKLDRDISGFITHEEIKNKADYLLGDETVKDRALHLKELTVSSIAEAGRTYKNFQDFITWMKGR